MKPFKRCWCRDAAGKLLGKKCPDLSKRNHGKWYGRYEAPGVNGVRRQPTIGPFDTEKECKYALAEASSKTARTGRVQDTKLTVAELLEKRYLQRMEEVKTGGLAKTTMDAEREAIDLYLKPGLGHFKLVNLRDSDISDLYAAMRLINRPDVEVPARLSELMRRLTEARAVRNQGTGRAWSTRPISEARITRIHAVLTGALNHAVKVMKILDSSPAVGLFPRKRSSYKARDKPLLWADERVEYWQKTGKVPGKVMVWAPKHAGAFLDFVSGERLYALFHLAAYWGPRRGEIVGLERQDFSVPRRRFHVRQAQPDDELDEVKSGDSNRYVIFDDLTAEVMSQWFERQDAEREAWGAEYEDSGRVFTYEDGRALRPEYVTDAFTWQVNKYNAIRRRRDEQGWDIERIARVHRMSVERVEIALSGPPLPPVRFHDLRHGAATMAAAAGVDMKVISDNLGHASESFTADVYAVVAEELAADAARKIGGFVPRRATA